MIKSEAISELEKTLHQKNPLRLKYSELLNKITNIYSKPKSFEKSGKLYKILGVDLYNKYLWRPTVGKLGKILRMHDEKWIKGNSTNSLEEYIQDTKIGEGWHLLCTLGVYYLMGFTPEAHVVNTIGNFYPIMIQRSNRVRVDNVLEKRKLRASSTNQNNS